MMKIKYSEAGFSPEKPVNNHEDDLPPIIKDSGNPGMIRTITPVNYDHTISNKGCLQPDHVLRICSGR
jgi:hypothetical protein